MPIKKRKYPAILEIIPLFLFFALNKYLGIFFATGTLIVTSVLNLIISYLYTKHLHPISVITALLALVFGTMTITFHNADFIKIKVTLINVIFALILLSTYFVKKNFLKVVFKDQVSLKPKGWRILNIAWILFFIILAIFNEVVWRNFSTNTWVNFKVFGIIVATMVFLLIQYPIIKKYSTKDDTEE